MMKMNTMLTGGIYGKSEGRKSVTYLCCGKCGRSMVKSWICVWTEDKYGQPHNVTLLHYHCQEEFELKNADKGKWFSRGMPARFITW